MRFALIMISLSVLAVLLISGTALAQTPEDDQYIPEDLAGGGLGPTVTTTTVTDSGLFSRQSLPSTGIALALLAGSAAVGVGATIKLMRKSR